jgi:hypothetical protein
LIATGLIVLLAAASWPNLPVVTGMALVALGASLATVERFRGASLAAPVLFGHLATYGAIYVLFAGAALHAASRTAGGIGWVVAIDLTISIWPLAIATALVIDALREGPLAE